MANSTVIDDIAKPPPPGPPAGPPAEPAARGLRARLARLLASPRAPWIIVAIGLALHLPGVLSGWTLDDHLQRARIQAALDGAPSPFAAYPPSLWDVFVFVPHEPALRHELLEHGVIDWTADPALGFSFFRPLSALTHVADNLLAPASPALAHLHSMLWLALLCAALFTYFRRLQPHAWVAALALLVYALDDARAPTVAWIANRNALIAAFFAVLALIAHHRARHDAWRPGYLLGPLALLAGLAAAEAAIAAFAFLLAHALTLDRAPWRDRVGALAPFAAAAAAWAVVHVALGYGVTHSGTYVDPAAEPLRFVAQAAVNVPVLLTAQLSGVWSELSLIAPIGLTTVVALACVGYLVAFGDAFAPLVVRSREARFWLVAMLLAAIPAASAVPTDRMLTFVGIAASGLVAVFLDAAWGRPADPAASRARRFKQRTWVVLVIAVHLVLAPLLVPLRSIGNATMGAFIARGESSLPRLADADADTLVIALNPPSEGMLAYAPLMRWANGEPPPGRLHALAPGRSALTITRESAGVLRVEPAEPYLELPMERLARQAPFAIGERVVLDGVTVEITAVTDDARPRATRWTFAAPLDDARRVRFVRWSDDAIAFVPFSPPPVGASVTLPAVDMVRAFRGY